MAKRTPSSKLKDADLHTMPVQDTVMMNPSNAQALPPVVKSTGKTKAKTKPETLRDDEPLASDQDVIVNAPSQYTSADASQDVLLAQANTSSSAPSAPSSVGEDLLRQAGPVPTKTTNTQDTGFFSSPWGLPVAIGGGALALAGGGGGGGGGGPSTPPAASAETTSFTVTPYAGKFIDSTDNVTVKLYKVSATGVETEISDNPDKKTVVKNGSIALRAKNTDLVLATGEYLKVELTDNNQAADFIDEAQQTEDGSAQKVSLGVNSTLTTLLSAAPKAGTTVAITPLTTVAASIFKDGNTTDPAGIQKAIDASNDKVAKAFGIQSSLTTTNPADSGSYQKALGLISGYAESKGATSTDSKTSDVVADLKAAITKADPVAAASAIQAILKAGFSKLPDNYSDPNGSSPFVVSSLELTDTTTPVDGKPTVNLVNYNDGLTIKIYPGTGTRVGDKATLTFTDTTSNAKFTYVYTFTGNSVEGTELGNEIYSAETITIPRFSNLNLAALTEYTDANGNTLLPLTDGRPDGAIHHYSVDLSVGTLGVGKGLSDIYINTAPVTLSNPELEGSLVFCTTDTLTVSVVLNEKVAWAKGNPTFKLHVADGSADGYDIILALVSGFTGTGSTVPTNVLTFQAKLKDIGSHAGPISIGSNAIEFPAGAVIMNAPGGRKDAAWFNALVDTTLTSSLSIDTVLPSQAHLEVANTNDVVVLDATQASKSNLTTGDRVTQKNQLALNVTVEDLAVTGTGATVRLFYSKDPDRTDDNKSGLVALGTKAVTDGNSVVSFEASDYHETKNGTEVPTYIGGPTGPSEKGSLYYLYTQVVDAAGNVGPLSSAFKVVLDNTAPIAPTLDLATADDWGQFTDDNITSVHQPKITVTGEKGAKVTLFDDANSNDEVDAGELLSEGYINTTPDTGTTTKYSYSWKPTTDLSAGTHLLKAKLTDVAGNTSLVGALGLEVLDPLPSTKKPSLAFVSAPTAGASYNMVTDSQKTITATVNYERAMYVATDASALTLTLDVAGKTRIATYSGISEDRKILTFTYTLGSSSNDDRGLSGSVSITALNGANTVLSDIAGNPAPSGAASFTGTAPTIDTLAPALPTINLKTAAANSSNAQAGAVAIKAEADATVTVTFKNTSDTTKAAQTVVVTGKGTDASAEEVLAKLSSSQVAALGQGTIQVTAEAKDAAGNSSGATPATSASSFTLDTVAPSVTSVSEATTAAVTKDNIVFTVKFSEPLTRTPQPSDFTVANGMGTISSVLVDTSPGAQNSYRVTVIPKPNTASGQVQLGLSTDSTIQDAAGNKAADTLAKFSLATQAIDTQAPTVTAVTSSKAGSVATGAFDFIVTFSEAMGPAAIAGNPLSASNFAVTNGRVTSVTPVATKDGSVQYKVSVTPNAGVDASPSAKIELSLVGSADDTTSYVADALGNLASNAPLNVNGLGGSQAIDTKPPALPTVLVKTAAANSSNAQAGAVAIKAEADATVTVTFKNTSDTTKAAQTVVVTAKGTDASAEEVLARLSPSQVTALGQGTIQVTAEAKDAAGNSSGTTTTVSSFTLDTIAPTVRSISSSTAQLNSGGTATVTFTFSEDPGDSFVVGDVTVTGGTLSNITGSGLTRTATFTADTPNLSGQQASITVAANSYTDAALNTGAGFSSPASFIFVDTTAPTITGFSSTSSSGTYGIGRDISLRATASEAVGSAAYLEVTLNTHPAQTVRLTRNATNTTLFEGTYRVKEGDTTSGLSVTSFTANGTDGVGNAIATTLSSGSLGASLVIQGIAPAAPASFALNTASDTGVVGDYITTQTSPSFDFKGLAVGLTVKIYNDSNELYHFTASSEEMSNVKLPSALSVGNYDKLKVVQVDAIGNESTAVALPTTLQIQSPTAKPAALTDLTLDPTLDAQNQIQYEAGSAPITYVLDNSTFLSAPKFQFKGGTVGNTALLFRDIDGNGAYNKDKDILLGTAAITETSSGLHDIWIDPTNALANTSRTSQGYTDIKVVQQDATGQTSDASNAALGAASGPRAGLGLVIYNTSLGSNLADLTAFALAEAPTVASNTGTLAFNVRGTVPGAKVVITATQTINGGEPKEITLPATALTEGVNNLVVDVSGFEGTLSGFKAKQTWAGVTSATAINNTGSTDSVILDHVAPTVDISIDSTQGLLLGQGETRLVTFKFSEEVTDFNKSMIKVSSGTLTDPFKNNSDPTIWTATYTGAPGNTAPAYIFVGSGKFQDAAGNLNTDGADTNNILSFQFKPSNHAPTGANKTFTVNEDSSTTLTVADFGFADAGDTTPNALKNVIITTLPSAGTLTLDGAAVNPNQSIAVADITANKLVYKPATDANGAGYASIDFKVQDDGGQANGGVDTSVTANTLTFHVNSVNDAPTATGKPLALNEDSPYTFAVSDFGFADAKDSPANTLSSVIISTLPTAGTLKLNGVIVTKDQAIAVADISKLVYTPAANAYGDNYATIGFKLKDNGGTANGGVDTSAEASFTINVASVNDAPTGANKTFTVNEDSSTTLTVADFGFADASDTTPNALKNVIITTLPSAGTLTLDGAAVTKDKVISVADITAGKLVYAPAADANGTGYASIGFKVQDDGGQANGGADTSTSANTLTFNVTPVEDLPTGNVTISGYTPGTAPTVGQQLSASHNIIDPDGIPSAGVDAIRYQWYADGAEIVGATSSTFTLTSAQVGQAITAKAFYKDNGGTSEVVTTATDSTTHAPTATAAVTWPDKIDLSTSNLKFYSLDSTNTNAVVASNAQLIRGHDGVYVLDVNGDNNIDATDRTTYAQGLDATNSLSLGHLKLTLLSESSSTWSQLSSYTDWPAGDTRGASGVTGNDYWTSTVGISASEPFKPAHVVFNTTGNYVVLDNAPVAAPTRLHYNAFQVIAV